MRVNYDFILTDCPSGKRLLGRIVWTLTLRQGHLFHFWLGSRLLRKVQHSQKTIGPPAAMGRSEAPSRQLHTGCDGEFRSEAPSFHDHSPALISPDHSALMGR